MNDKPNDYLPDPFIQGTVYQHKTVLELTFWSIEMDTTFAVHTEVGLENRQSGDFLCKDADGKMWSIQRLHFLANYEQVTGDVPKAPILPPQVARSEDET